MFIKKAIILALFALFSNESFAATPIVRASAIQAGPAKSVTSSISNRAPIQGVTSGSLNKLHSNRVQVSTTPSTTPSTGISDKALDTLYEEVQKVQDSFEEEIRYTRQQIMDLKEEIAEKDEKIADLEKSLKEYEEIKETVKEIPNMYYSKRELEAKNFATKGDLEKVEFDRSAVVSLIDNRLATKKVVSEESLPKLDAFVQVKNTIAAIPKTYATAQYVDAAVNKETTARETGLTGLRDTLTQKIDAESTARANALTAEAAQRTTEISNLGNKYATIQNVDTKINEINNNIADDLLKNDNFKTQVLAGLSDDIKTLPNAVNNLTNKVNIIEGTFATTEDLNNYVKTTDLGSQVAELDEFEQVQQTVAAIPNIYAKTSDVTAAISNEATARANALGAETAARDTQLANLRDTLTQKIDDETAARKTALIAETSARETGLTGLHTTLSQKIDDETAARANEINRLSSTYATIDNVNNKFSNISDTIASDLLKNDEFKGQVLADLSDDIKNLPTTVTNLQNRLDEFDGKFVKIIDFDGKFDTRFDGIFADKIQNNDWLKKIRDDVDDIDGKFVKIIDFDGKFDTRFDGIFADKIQNNDWLKKIRDDVDDIDGKFVKIIDFDGKFDTRFDGIFADKIQNNDWLKKIRDDVDGFDSKFVKIDGFNNRFDGRFDEKVKVFDDTFVKVTDFDSKIKDNDWLKTLRGDVDNFDSAFARKDDLPTLLDDTFIRPAVLTEYVKNTDLNTKVAALESFANLRNRLDGFETTFAKKDELDTLLDGKFARPAVLANYLKTADLGDEIVKIDTFTTINNRLDGFDNKFTNIGDTVAAELLKNDEFKGQVLADLSDDIKNLPTTVTNLQDRINGFETTFAKTADLDTLLNDKFVRPALLDGYVKTADLGTQVASLGTIKDIQTTINGFDTTYVKSADLANSVENLESFANIRNRLDGFERDFTRTSDLDTLLADKYATPAMLNGYLKTADLGTKVATLDTITTIQSDIAGLDSKFAKQADIDTAIAGLDTTFVKPAVLNDYTKTADLTSILGTTFAKPADINSAIAGLDSKFAKQADIDTAIAGLDSVYLKPESLDAALAETPTVVALNNRFNGLGNTYLTQDALTPYLKTADLGDKVSGLEIITGLDTKFIKADALTPYLKTADLGTKVATLDTITTIQSDIAGLDSKFAKQADIDTAIAGLDTTFVKPAVLNDYTKTADLTSVLGTTFAKPADIDTAIAGLDTTFVKPADLTNYATTEGLNSAIAGLGTTYAKQADVTTLLNAYTPTSELVTTLEDTFPRRTEIGSFVSNELSNYTPTANLNTVVSVLPSITNLQTQVNDIPNVYAKSEDVASELTELENSINSVNTNLGSRITNLNTTVGNLGNVVNSHTTTLSDQADTLTLHANVLTNHEDVLADHEDVLENHESAISTANSNITLLNTNVTKLNTGELTLETPRLPVTALKPTVSLTPIISLDP